MGSYSFSHCELKPNRCAGRKRETNLPSLGSKIALLRETHLPRSQAMYACFLKSGADFARRCTGRKIGHLLFATHPYHPGSRIRFCASTRCPMNLAAVNLYSLL